MSTPEKLLDTEALQAKISEVYDSETLDLLQEITKELTVFNKKHNSIY